MVSQRHNHAVENSRSPQEGNPSTAPNTKSEEAPRIALPARPAGTERLRRRAEKHPRDVSEDRNHARSRSRGRSFARAPSPAAPPCPPRGERTAVRHAVPGGHRINGRPRAGAERIDEIAGTRKGTATAVPRTQRWGRKRSGSSGRTCSSPGSGCGSWIGRSPAADRRGPTWRSSSTGSSWPVTLRSGRSGSPPGARLAYGSPGAVTGLAAVRALSVAEARIPAEMREAAPGSGTASHLLWS